jgi:hypothetical protein
LPSTPLQRPVAIRYYHPWRADTSRLPEKGKPKAPVLNIAQSPATNVQCTNERFGKLCRRRAVGQDLCPSSGAGLDEVVDSRKEHGFLVSSQAVQDVFPYSASSGQERRGRPMASQLAENPADMGQQPLALLVDLAGPQCVIQ